MHLPVLLATEAGERAANFAEFDVPGWVWWAFGIGIVVLLLLDVLLVHRKPHEISFREAIIESAVWIAIGLSFGLVVMAENRRPDETATRHGGPNPAAEPGSYQLATDAALLLKGQDLGLPMDGIEIGALHFVPRLPAWKERKVSMLALELSTKVSLATLEPGAGALDDFAAFHANWDLPPHGNVDGDPDAAGVQIPADATADATDHVQLETQE